MNKSPLEIVQEALEFYAHPASYIANVEQLTGPIDQDLGRTAFEALKVIRNLKKVEGLADSIHKDAPDAVAEAARNYLALTEGEP